MTATLYVLSAIISTFINLGSQYLILLSDIPYSLHVAIVIGTGSGLISKYIIDHKYVFKSGRKSLSAHKKSFGIYTFLGLFTTIIFWGVEYLFSYMFSEDIMTVFGGFIGLVIGYTVKFFLDRKFVFC